MARPSKSEQFEELRRKAEERLRRLGIETHREPEAEDVASLLHELSVHQAELEMQNEELRQARERTEQALERYSELYDSAPVGYLTLDRRGTIEKSNLAAARLLQAERQKLVSDSFLRYVAQSSRGVLLRFLGKVFESREPQYCEVAPANESSPASCIRMEGVLKVDPEHGREVCWVAIIDVSETKRTQDELRKAYDEMEDRVEARTAELAAANDNLRWAREEAETREAELKSFLATALDGLILADAGGNIVFANEASTRMLGARIGEPVRKIISGLRISTPDGKPLPPHALPTCRALEGETIREQTHRVALSSGREFVVSASAAPIVDSEGEVLGAASVYRDVTEKVAWEKRKDELYAKEHHISEVLQSTLIPPKIECTTPGVEIAVEYMAADEEARVGGDFYDVIQLDGNRCGILIGDVVGMGLTAAIRVAAVRYAVRSYAYIDASPGVVMTRANDALCRDTEESVGGGQMLTGLFAVVDPEQRTVMHANGGHEPPFLVRPDGLAREVNVQGQMLGVVPGYCYPEATQLIEPGDVIVLLTDGITEAGRNSHVFGAEGVLSCLARHAGEPPAQIAKALLEEAIEHAHGRLRDDAAIVALRLT